MTDVNWVAVWLITTAMVVAYFIPWLTAWGRNHRQAAPIFVLNLFLGWTLLGWVAALVWALVRDRRPESAPAAPGPIVFTYHNHVVSVDRATGVARTQGREFASDDAARNWIDQQMQAQHPADAGPHPTDGDGQAAP